jgi:xanthine dehydrogenase/oxidase
VQESANVLLLLIFQYVLGLSPPNLPENLVSGGKILERPVSTGKQDFETNKSVWPLNKPVPKLEAVTQCSGKTDPGYSVQFYKV